MILMQGLSLADCTVWHTPYTTNRANSTLSHWLLTAADSLTLWVSDAWRYSVTESRWLTRYDGMTYWSDTRVDSDRLTESVIEI